MVAPFDVAVLVAAVAVVGVVVVAVAQSCDAVTADVVAVGSRGVEEVPLVAGAAFVGEHSDIV